MTSPTVQVAAEQQLTTRLHAVTTAASSCALSPRLVRLQLALLLMRCIRLTREDTATDDSSAFPLPVCPLSCTERVSVPLPAAVGGRSAQGHAGCQSDSRARGHRGAHLSLLFYRLDSGFCSPTYFRLLFLLLSFSISLSISFFVLFSLYVYSLCVLRSPLSFVFSFFLYPFLFSCFPSFSFLSLSLSLSLSPVSRSVSLCPSLSFSFVLSLSFFLSLRLSFSLFFFLALSLFLPLPLFCSVFRFLCSAVSVVSELHLPVYLKQTPCYQIYLCLFVCICCVHRLLHVNTKRPNKPRCHCVALSLRLYVFDCVHITCVIHVDM